MNDESIAPEAPVEFGERGASLWRELHACLEFDVREVALIVEACRTVDIIDELAGAVKADGLMSAGSTGQPVVNPAVAELRQQQAAFARLIGALKFPEDDAAADRFRTVRAKAGAAARWDRPRAVS